MTDNEKRTVAEITMLEAEEFEKMARIIEKKHEALSRLDVAAIGNAVSEELEELDRIQKLEIERAAGLKSLGIEAQILDDPAALTVRLGESETADLTEQQKRLRRTFFRVRDLNTISRELLSHSIEFIGRNIRIITDGGTRKLVDRKA